MVLLWRDYYWPHHDEPPPCYVQSEGVQAGWGCWIGTSATGEWTLNTVSGLLVECYCYWLLLSKDFWNTVLLTYDNKCFLGQRRPQASTEKERRRQPDPCQWPTRHSSAEVSRVASVPSFRISWHFAREQNWQWEIFKVKILIPIFLFIYLFIFHICYISHSSSTHTSHGVINILNLNKKK